MGSTTSGASLLPQPSPDDIVHLLGLRFRRRVFAEGPGHRGRAAGCRYLLAAVPSRLPAGDGLLAIVVGVQVVWEPLCC